MWEPHFGPLLMDALAEDVFGQVGRITTLNDFAAQSFNKTPFLGAKVISLVLAGAREQAAEYVEEIERDDRINGYAKNLVREQWNRVSGDLEAVCAEFHAKEAATIKALKFEHFWEPSPFPCELPAAERISRSAEPTFLMLPWIDRPEWLLAEAPEQPGQMRFAKEIHLRGDRVILQVPLAREEAEDTAIESASATQSRCACRMDCNLRPGSSPCGIAMIRIATTIHPSVAGGRNHKCYMALHLSFGCRLGQCAKTTALSTLLRSRSATVYTDRCGTTGPTSKRASSDCMTSEPGRKSLAIHRWTLSSWIF